jgi:hypothetical protein
VKYEVKRVIKEHTDLIVHHQKSDMFNVVLLGKISLSNPSPDNRRQKYVVPEIVLGSKNNVKESHNNNSID